MFFSSAGVTAFQMLQSLSLSFVTSGATWPWYLSYIQKCRCVEPVRICEYSIIMLEPPAHTPQSMTAPAMLLAFI